MPLSILKQWIEEERQAGAPNPQQAVLATIGQNNIPHSRVVAIREISNQDLLFFTQSSTRKVIELRKNPHISLNFWFELKQRQVIIEGQVAPLSEQENQSYWFSYPKEAQVRFLAYAPTSSQVIPSKQILEQRKKLFARQFTEQPVPFTPLYIGYRIIPSTLRFYAYRQDELSDVWEFNYQNQGWKKDILSP
ncbi:pyridoxine/pyridoxamine 5'-phosphate oxidase [Legionella jordanis]|uniref:Pyridoxamine 5'-phosphate oxidase n=1 Tax=Legionella jordanis TaxID=456 RepID=A0A0W0V949_9GAMM|nr:pyridoxal 5'-phosphate synthase [Legionella jordanis]KTD16624.1 pyridoxamine 5'-phosphate oxidase [Legionella jordanis]RMX03839.1 pyridoxal 5'-phosphate synthase [Legionella jordanis]VEH11912.1 pyridoxamine 5'-phosphate oxidase [Legionella jordanis]HAT8712784.1 pyridoxal 5'-phosphate synthase [Legionella jordanis]